MTTKTMRMHEDTLRRWLGALRSGKYAQGMGRLQGINGGYCCLGVLQMAIDISAAYPTPEWSFSKGISAITKAGYFDPIIYDYSGIESSLGQLNDSGIVNFEYIADVIEAHTETYR